MKLIDPIEAAKEEGKIYGRGVTGDYKKNIITRIGFLMIGLCFLIGGVLMLHLFSQEISGRSAPGGASSPEFLIFGLGGCAISIPLISHALKK